MGLEAECICGKHDARLCTREEIEGNCAKGTGCSFDAQVVWTSTIDDSEPSPTSSPVAGTIDEQCADETDGDSTNLRHWAACGRVRRCGSQPTGGFNFDVPHEVRCCSDTSKPGWKKNSGCDVWAQSKMNNVCYEAKNFLEAECICGKHDARLCTREEIEGNCAKGTGCGFDRQVVWTSTIDDSELSPTSSPVAGTIDEQCADETDGASTPIKYLALCGRVGRCGSQ